MALETKQEKLKQYRVEADAAREALAAEYEQLYGEAGVGVRSQMDAWRDFEAARLEAAAMLREKGLRETYVNGRQRVERENKALGQMCKIVAAQTKIKQSLRLLPTGRGSAGKDEDAEDDGDDLNDY